ncbi:MAG: TRAP transporter fused permease subunit, partial [Oscillospiraceae bacterium]|nr:TRAP transporter fused permease subunit [Oscillospiraceae bacterium]
MDEYKNPNEVVEAEAHVDIAAEVDAVMKKYDRESNTRIWQGTPKAIIIAIEALFALFCIYVTLFATWQDHVRLASFVGLIILMGYLVFPAKKGLQTVNHIPWYDIVIMVLGTASYLYLCLNAADIIPRLPTIYLHEIIIGIIGILALMELCRRSVGIPILCVAGFFLLYAIYYYLFVNNLGANTIRTLTYRLFYTTTGILSTPVNVCSKYIVIFILFGAFLERTGVADFFIQFANAIAGAASGGPAKVAVIASALEGMVSGSSVANTVGSGSVTIPMMKRTGYRPEFAAAVEAAASTGGQIMPPIMGAAAFLMADYVGLPYSNIIVCAILPALLYFLGIFITVHLEARRQGLKGISRDELPRIKDLIKKTYLLLPLIILVYLVSSNTKTMAYSAVLAILFAIAVSNMRKDPILSITGCAALLVSIFVPLSPALNTAITVVGILSCLICMLKKNADMPVSKCVEALAAGSQSCISVVAACGVAGIISGCITMTGLASQLITAITSASQAFPPALQTFIALFLTMLCCIVLGMGVPTTANYCIMASTCAPILITMGVPALAAHFFVFYFGIVADLTPPVALAAYAGAAIAKSDPMKTAMEATKL